MTIFWNRGTYQLLDIKKVCSNSWDLRYCNLYPNDLSLLVNVIWQALTGLPRKNRRWRRSRCATLWDPWRTHLRRCWACPERWGGQLLSPIPGKKEKTKRGGGSGDEDQRCERDGGYRQRNSPTFRKRRAWAAATQGGRRGVRGT